AVSIGRAPTFTTAEVKAIWDYAKANYIDQGGITFDELVTRVANDLGLKNSHVIEAFSSPKSTRAITNEMYAAMSRRRQAVNAAKSFIESGNLPAYAQVAKTVWNIPRGLAVFGHGTVGMVTHAGENIFQPSVGRVYWDNFGKQFSIFW